MAEHPFPREIGRSGRNDVRILWEDGHETILPARDLRLACPCAACVDETTGEVRLDARGMPADVHPVSIAPIGRYAVRVGFSDGHDAGLFTYDYLRGLCPCGTCGGGKGPGPGEGAGGT